MSREPRAASRARMARAVLGLTIGWSVLAGGMAGVWLSPPLVVASVVLVALARPRLCRAESRTLDLALLATLAATAVTVVPLPTALVAVLSPHRAVVLDALAVGPRVAHAWEPLSLDADRSAYAAALAAVTLAIFWSCRQMCAAEGPRRIVRTIVGTGLMAAVAALVQPAVDPLRLYGMWQPLDEGARPFGPFVNRNHFATWALLAIPLVLGCVATSLVTHRTAPTRAATVASWGRALGSGTAWGIATVCLLTLGLVLSASRSGLLGAVVVSCVFLGLGRRRLSARAQRWALVAGLALAAFLAYHVRTDRLLARAEETLVVGAGDRPQIWRDTVSVADDFRVTGTGPGTFPTSMLVYQRADRWLFSNQAHNHYLQVLAEGGAIAALPLLVAAVAFIRLLLRQARRDETSQIWMRLGAVAGIAGVAVQSGFETGLRMPGNAVLFAVAAAVAVHPPRRRARVGPQSG
jgi:hypothetical protein